MGLTKLEQWFSALSVVFTIYLAVILSDHQFVRNWYIPFALSPVFAVVAFGVSSFDANLRNTSNRECIHLQLYSIYAVLHGVFTFRECPEAAEEIQRQIKEARSDLKSKGLKLWIPSMGATTDQRSIHSWLMLAVNANAYLQINHLLYFNWIEIKYFEQNLLGWSLNAIQKLSVTRTGVEHH